MPTRSPYKVLLTGAGGLLGKKLVERALESQIMCPFSRNELDVANAAQVRARFEEVNPDVCIHAAAMTTPMRAHQSLPTLSIETNIVGTASIAQQCWRYHTRLVYISTDYVYPGDVRRMWGEEDGVRPVNKYAWSKMGGECVAHMLDDALIVRCSHSDEPFKHPKAVTDAYKTPMSVDKVATYILQLIEREATGVYNIGGESQSVYDFAKQSKPDVGKITRQDIDEPVALDTSMDTTKLLEFLDDPTI